MSYTFIIEILYEQNNHKFIIYIHQIMFNASMTHFSPVGNVTLKWLIGMLLS